MTKKCLAIAASFLLLLSVNAFGQNSAVSGTVSDTSSALIPGVMMTATNTQTGIVTTALTNEAGAYSFPSLQPGTYKMSAELPGFRRFLQRLKTKDYRRISLFGCRLELHHRLRWAVQDGDRDHTTIVLENARHAEFFAENAWHRIGVRAEGRGFRVGRFCPFFQSRKLLDLRPHREVRRLQFLLTYLELIFSEVRSQNYRLLI